MGLGSCFAAGVLVHYFSPDGWEGWSLRGRPAIRDQMPVLIDDDLRFEDGSGPRPATVMIPTLARRLRTWTD